MVKRRKENQVLPMELARDSSLERSVRSWSVNDASMLAGSRCGTDVNTPEQKKAVRRSSAVWVSIRKRSKLCLRAYGRVTAIAPSLSLAKCTVC